MVTTLRLMNFTCAYRHKGLKALAVANGVILIGAVAGVVSIVAMAQAQAQMSGYPQPGTAVDRQFQETLRPYSYLEEQNFRSGAPRYYVVQEGDTYHSIAQRFLTNPQGWGDAWKLPTGMAMNMNAPLQAGSVVVLSKVNGAQFTVFPQGQQALARRYGEYYGIKTGPNSLKLLPAAYGKPNKENNILPSGMIEPFKAEANVVPYQDIEGAPIVAGFPDNRILGYPGKEVYVRGTIDEKIREWYVYAPAERMVDPDSHRELGYISRLLGIVRPIRKGEGVYVFDVIGGYQEFSRGSRLVPVDKNRPYQDYSYQKPAGNIRGRVVGIYDGSTTTTQFRNVIINRGAAQGVKRGDVFNLLSHQIVSYSGEIPLDTLPLRGYGRIYVYRVEENTSFALVIEGYTEVTLYDVFRPITEDEGDGRGSRAQSLQPTMPMGAQQGANNVQLSPQAYPVLPTRRGVYRE